MQNNVESSMYFVPKQFLSQIRRHFSLPLLRLRRNSSCQRIFIWRGQCRWWTVPGPERGRTHIHCARIRIQSGCQCVGVLPRVGRPLQSGCHSRDGFDWRSRMGTCRSGVHLADSGINGSSWRRSGLLSGPYECQYHAGRRHFSGAGLMWVHSFAIICTKTDFETVIEMFLTAQLVITIFLLAAEKHKGTFLAPVGIGLSLFIAELSGVYFTGGKNCCFCSILCFRKLILR